MLHRQFPEKFKGRMNASDKKKQVAFILYVLQNVFEFPKVKSMQIYVPLVVFMSDKELVQLLPMELQFVLIVLVDCLAVRNIVVLSTKKSFERHHHWLLVIDSGRSSRLSEEITSSLKRISRKHWQD